MRSQSDTCKTKVEELRGHKVIPVIKQKYRSYEIRDSYQHNKSKGATRSQSHTSKIKTRGATRSQTRTSKIKLEEPRGHKVIPVKSKLEELRGHRVKPVKQR